MKRKLFTAVCILLASAIAPCGASAKAKKDAKKDIGIQLYSVRDLIGSVRQETSTTTNPS